MINLIRSDLYKLVKSKAFYVCLVLAVVISLASPILYKLSSEMLVKYIPSDMNEMMNSSSLPGVSGNIGLSSEMLMYQGEVNAVWFTSQLFSGNTLIVFIAILLAITITKEFSYGTMKNVLSKGFSKYSIYLSKLVSMLVVVTALFVATTIASFVIAAILYGVGPITSQILLNLVKVLIMEYILHLAFASVFVMIGMVVRNTAGCIAFNLLLIMIGGLLFYLITLLTNNHFQAEQFWIMTAIANMSNLWATTSDVIKSIAVVAGYLGMSTAIGMLVFKKQEIK